MSTAVQKLQSPRAIARLKSAQVVVRSEMETFDSATIKHVLEKFGDLICAFAHTPEGLAAADHAMDWQWLEEDFVDERYKKQTKEKDEPGLWQGMEHAQG